MAPGTEFVRDFCAGIGPLQLGVVLVIIITMYNNNNDKKNNWSTVLALTILSSSLFQSDIVIFQQQ